MSKKKHLGIELRCLSNMIKRKIDTEVAERVGDNITGMQCHVIGFVAHNGDKALYQRDIEEKLQIRRSTATEMLKLMEKNGLIKREAVNEDARLKRIILTEKALEIDRTIAKAIDHCENALLEGISDEEYETLIGILDKIRNNIQIDQER
ncbi:MAG: MarR family transcriptional regulator [Ruminococcaceae bacterium]|nr:MarR family transcriptional regulator [Oscillospiraceae bacterium]